MDYKRRGRERGSRGGSQNTQSKEYPHCTSPSYTIDETIHDSVSTLTCTISPNSSVLTLTYIISPNSLHLHTFPPLHIPHLQHYVVLEGVFDAAHHVLCLSLRQLHRRRRLEQRPQLCKLRDSRQLLGIPVGKMREVEEGGKNMCWEPGMH